MVSGAVPASCAALQGQLMDGVKSWAARCVWFMCTHNIAADMSEHHQKQHCSSCNAHISTYGFQTRLQTWPATLTQTMWL